jgi:long-chain fatty acid transport protein
MGGAGTAAPLDLLGTLYLNPAGLMAFEGTRVDLGFEFFKPDRTVASDVTVADGSTRSKSEFTPIPAFAWSTKLNNEKVVVALGGLGIGGFGVDYPQDNTNPILGPRPAGFGQIYSNYGLLKLSAAAAWAITPKLWIGGAFNVNWAQLSVDPAPFAAPDPDTGTFDNPYYSRATATDGAFGFGGQLGLYYEFNDMIQAGLSYSTRQFFEDFEWNATYENPNNPTFGQDRTLKFRLDVPAYVTGGLAVYAMPNLLLTGDVRYFFYEDTPGFQGSGFDQQGAVVGFGWQNIFVFAGGLQWKPVSRWSIRAGYNYSQNPITDEGSFFNVPAPAIMQHHATLGLGYDITRRFAVSAAYYHVFTAEQSGPFQSPMGPVDGTTVTNSMSENSLLPQFSFATRGGV